jgi:hypothetical protein
MIKKIFLLLNIKYKVNLNILPNNQKNIINNINGFYGLIGPEYNISHINSLFELFIGHGNIQGVFFNNGNITFIKKFINTDIYNFEKKYGKIKKNIFTIFFFMLLNKLKLFPNIIGVANTALLNQENNLYAFFERDKPYLLNINYDNCEINTINKIKCKLPNYFSGHTKYINNMIETIDYDTLKKKVIYYSLYTNMTINKKIIINTQYIPIIHDFYSDNNYVYICVSPFKYSFNKIPIKFNKKEKTYIYQINKNTFEIKKYISNIGFFIFHFANVIETDNLFIIYTSLYNDNDFNNLNIHGKYNKLILNKLNLEINIIEDTDINKFNLDFPIKYNNKIILRNIQNKKINGFIVMNDLSIYRKLIYDEYYFCGEAQIINNNNKNYLISFGYDNKNNYIFLIDIETTDIIKIPLNNDHKLNIGFHSIYLKK